MKEQTHLHDAVSVTLREAREYARLSQGELAERAGCARSFISFLETGSHLPGLNAFMALADALGISPSELMRRIEERMAFHKNIHAWPARMYDVEEWYRHTYALQTINVFANRFGS